MFRDFNIEYDKQALIDFYRSLPANPEAQSVNGGLKSYAVSAAAHPEIERLWNLFPIWNSINPENMDKMCAFMEIVGESAPHTNMGNNGLIIVPLLPPVKLELFSYEPPLDADGRPNFPASPANYRVEGIWESTYLRREFTTPFAVNGQKVYRLKHIVGETPMALIFKIPLSVSFDEVVLK
jgi:hypothetical protein